MWQQLATLIGAIHFQYPALLWAWPVSAFAVGLLVRKGRLTSLANAPRIFSAQRYRHTQLPVLRQLHGNRPQHQTTQSLVWRWLSYAMILLGIHGALAFPYRTGQQLPTPPEYRDTLFLLDTSVSMILRDYLVDEERVDRMTMLKSVLTYFIDQLQGNRIGLIAFSEQPYTLVPLTADYALLKNMVRRLEPAVLTGRTSNLGAAMLYTLQQLEQSSAHPHQKPVLVLVSDVNRTQRDVDPRAVAAYLHQQGYRLHTIGIGAATYEAQDTDYRGLIYHPVNFDLLKSIAEKGGGQFYWADSTQSLQYVMQAIQQGERQQIKVEPRFITIPLYPWPLLISLLGLIILQSGMGWRRPA
jgi:Ca-activated chloride channel homolog